jgi:hypothetical protein
VDTGSLDRFGCTGHWASSGCIRLLTAAAVATQPGITGCISGLALLPPDAFAALWARSEAADGSSSSAPCDWHVPYSRLLPLEEAYGGLYRELKAGGYNLSHCHYMLRWVAALHLVGQWLQLKGCLRQCTTSHDRTVSPTALASSSPPLLPCVLQGLEDAGGAAAARSLRAAQQHNNWRGAACQAAPRRGARCACRHP